MKFLSRLFSRSTDDYLAKGNSLFESQRYFEARTLYEKGLVSVREADGETGRDVIVGILTEKIARANAALADLNINEAEFAIGNRAEAKAVEHLELAITLTDDPAIREKAEKLLSNLLEKVSDPAKSEVEPDGCNSCSSSSCNETRHNIWQEDPDMSPEDYYDLLIRQLPSEMYDRYAVLGEEFACLYLAASKDDHETALNMLEAWYQGDHSDIYCYEKGMILYRLGKVRESEMCIRDAIEHCAANPLPHLGLALLLIDSERLEEAADHLDDMIKQDILHGQALMLRGEVSLLSGDHNSAIDNFGKLLATPLARPAAEKLHGVLMQCGRQQEAGHILKQYLGGCSH